MNTESFLKPLEEPKPFLRKISKEKPQGIGRVLQVFFGADMRNGIDGLTSIAHGFKIFLPDLKAGQYVVFVNNRRDIIKVATANRVVATKKLEGGQTIDLETIALIPKSFLAHGELNYDEALREVLTRKVSKEKLN